MDIYVEGYSNQNVMEKNMNCCEYIDKNALKQEIEKWYRMKNSRLDFITYKLLIQIIDKLPVVKNE